MSAAELKEIKVNLVSWINHLSDKSLISFLEGLRNSQTKKDWWEELTPAQKKHVLSSIKEADEGKLLSSTSFHNRLKNA